MVADQRKYQIVVLGATGFTGQRVAKEIIESGFKGSYALAGRDESKLKHLASSLQNKSAGILIADVNDPPSLQAMASQAQVILNCVGPFRFYGQPVVAVCISQKTSYLDICGEPEFIERMELHYHAAAAAAGIHIASAVGFDSVPGDLGSLWTARLFNNTINKNYNSKSICTQVETFISIKSSPAGFKGHYPTWESAVNGVGSTAELTAIRKQAKLELFYHHKSGATGKNATKVGKLKRHGGPFYDKRLQSWALPFIGADASVVRRTMAMEASMKQDRGGRGEKALYTSPMTITSPPPPSQPPQSAVYFTVSSFFYLILFIIAGTVFQVLASKEWGRRLLLKYPAFFSFGGFSHQGPSEEQLQQTRFEIVNFAKGVEYSNDNNSNAPSSPPSHVMKERSVVTSITGPEPGYVACSIFIVAAAIVMLEEIEKLPPPGVWTPGMLLINTSYIERVRRRGVEFTVVNQS
jgi:short subunit dehydrogenase-like uncharacterized protein